MLKSLTWALPVFLLAFPGCAGPPVAYPGTDVLEVPGFKLVTASDLLITGGQLRRGELAYSGRGDFREVYREYVAAMVEEGWSSTHGHVGFNRATATLRKDNRAAVVDFATRDQEEILATVRVTTTPVPEAR